MYVLFENVFAIKRLKRSQEEAKCFKNHYDLRRFTKSFSEENNCLKGIKYKYLSIKPRHVKDQNYDSSETYVTSHFLMRTVPSQTGINVLNQFQTTCKVPVRKTKYQ